MVLACIGALERPVPGVGVDVEGQLSPGDKLLTAVGAGQVAAGIVILHMIVQPVLGLEQFTTLLTLKR
jgi:hypothetical protein